MLRNALLLLFLALHAGIAMPDATTFDAFEASIPEMQSAMREGRVTSEQLVRQYLERIGAYDDAGPALNAMLIINPRALEVARRLDRERAEQGPRGPLHGIPIVLKDNYDTFDMPTTAGAIAMDGFVPPDDGYQVRRLRAAGAVFIGKTNLHEFARGIETVSSLGGWTRNPYDPRRNPGGSSGGTGAAVAANFAAAGMGSDTCGSIRIPAANNNLFGLRVTQGLSSRDGIIPLSHTQDVGGPLARSMIDLVTLLDATTGADPADPQTADADAHLPATWHEYLLEDALDGARLGLLTEFLRTAAPYGEVSGVVRAAAATLREHGADVVDIEVAGLSELLRSTSVIDYEFTTDVEAYLESSGAPLRSIAELLESGRYHEALDTRYRRSVARAADQAEYQERLQRREDLTRLLLDTMDRHQLDALIYPTLRIKPVFVGEPQHGSVCQLAAHSGFPAIAMPAGFTPDGVPVGIELAARPFDDGRLVAFAYAWERVAAPRRAPLRTPSLLGDTLSWRFVIDAPSITGRLRLERPTQTLHYDVEVTGLDEDDIVSVTLHRAAAGTYGPVIMRLDEGLQGAIPIGNAHVDDLVSGNLRIVVHTRGRKEVRGQIEKR